MQNNSLYKEGIEHYQKKDYTKAIEIFKQLIQEEPKNSDPYANIAVIKKIQEDYKGSFEYLKRAIDLNPNNSQYHANMGNLFRDVGNFKNAINAYATAIKLNPKDAMNLNNLGIVYEKMGDDNKAIIAYKEAVRRDGSFAKAVNNIGVILYKQKKYQEASDIFTIALKTDPEYYDVYSNKGACLNKLKKYTEAIIDLQKAIKHNPKNAGPYTNLGNVYYKQDKYKDAIKQHEKSLKLDPNGSNAHSNIANAFKQLGYTDKAITSYKKAIELDPNFINAKFDLATSYLMKEDFKNGWAEYENRFLKDEMKSHIIKHKNIFSKKKFDGKIDIKDKILLVHSEQGFGDSIQFVRFVCVLKDKYNCKVILSTREELVSLFKSLPNIYSVISRESENKLPDFDYQVSILSLPYILNMKLSKDIPLDEPYLKPLNIFNELDIKKQKGIINIGINWSASITGESYDGKVFDIKYLEPLFKHKRIQVYNLQVGQESADIIDAGFENDLIDLTSELKSFEHTAYLINQLDLVISSDTSVAHLAGALNKEVWIPLQKMPDWRWLKKGEKSIWYKSAKLFRQKTVRQWDSVFQSVFAKMSKQFKIRIK